MRKELSILLIMVTLGATWVVFGSSHMAAGAAASLRIVDYNVKCTQCAGSQARWTYQNRGNNIVNYLNSGIDVAGLNEVSTKAAVSGDPNSWDSLKAGLTGFTGFKASQSQKTYYPDTALFAKNATVQVLSSGYRKTTSGISQGVDEYSEERPITYAKLRQRATGAEFVVVSAHFTAMGGSPHNNSEAATALAFIDKEFGKDIPILFMGDYYIWGCDVGGYSEPYGAFVKYGYKDAFDAKVAAKRVNVEYNTYVAGGHPGGVAAKCGTSDGKKQYDHIFVRGNITVNSATINISKQYSDHLPVEVEVTLAANGSTTGSDTGSEPDAGSTDSGSGSNSDTKSSSRISKDEVGLSSAATSGSIQGILNLVYFFAGVTTVAVAVLSGFKYVASSGNPEKVRNAKDTLLFAIVGIVVVLVAFVITNFIIESVG